MYNSGIMSVTPIVRLALKIFLFASSLVVLIYSNNVILPFTLPRIIFFRAIVEISILLLDEIKLYEKF